MTKQMGKVLVMLMVGLWAGLIVLGGVVEAASDEVGIGFNDNPTKLPISKGPHDDTPKAKEPIVTKRPLLPQTGEMLTHLGILISGMLVIILMFVMALDKQIRLSED